MSQEGVVIERAEIPEGSPRAAFRGQVETDPPDRPPRRGWVTHLAWLPVPLLLAAIIAARVSGLRGSYEPHNLRLVLSLVFHTLVSLGTLILIGRSFLASGRLGLLVLECGVILWSLAGTVGDAVNQGDANINVTIFNTGIFLAALCHLTGAALALRPQRALGARPLCLAAGCVLALGALGLVTWAALAGRLPVFFIPGQGGTPMRYCVLMSAITMFVLSAGLLHTGRPRMPLSFTSWYALALLLMAVGLFGIMIQLSLGSVVNWLARSAEWLGGVYLLIAALAAMRESRLPLLAFQEKSPVAYYRYVMAVVVVLAAGAVRAEFLQALETRAAFITFYPAVMLTALYGGLGPGILATVLSATAVNYFFMEPVGQFSVSQPSDVLSLLVFLPCGTMISIITDAMHRAWVRVTAAEADARAAAERQRAAEALRESQERLSLALASARMATFDWDIIRNTRVWDDNVHRLLGTTPGTFSGTAEEFFQVIHPDDRSAVQAALSNAVQAGAYETAYRALWPDGSIRHIAARGVVQRDESGRAVRMTGVCWDITERKRVEEALRESDARLRAILDQAPCGITIREVPSGKILLSNRQAVGILGNVVPAFDEVVQYQGIHPDGKSYRREDYALVRAAENGETVRGEEFTFHRGDGECLTLNVSAAPIHGADGQTIAAVAVFDDITERKRAEKKLREAEHEKSLILDNADEFIALHDTSNNLIWSNKAYIDATGLPLSKLKGQKCYAGWGLDRPCHGCPVISAIRTGEPQEAEVTPHNQSHLRADHGTWQVRAAPVKDSAGNVIGAIEVAHDITERKRAEQELHKLNRTLRALSKSNQALMHSRGESEYLDEVCKIIVEDCGHSLVWIGYAEQDEARTVRPIAHAGFEAGYLETLKVTWADTERGRGPTGTAIRSGQPSGCSNMLTDPRFRPWRQEALRRGYASSMVLPLRSDGRTFGAITIYAREPESFSEAELRLLMELADDVANGITTIRGRLAQAQAEEAIKTTLESIGDGFFAFDADWRFVYVNAAAERILGIRREEVLGKSYSEAFLVGSGTHERLESEYRRAAAGERRDFENFYEPLGRWFHNRCFPREGGGMSVYFEDITERKRMEEALATAKAGAEAANAAKDHFLAVLSHELRTPLAPVLMIAGALENDKSLPEPVRKDMEMIDESIRMEVRLIDDLLDVNRISRGKLELELEETDAHVRIMAALEICRSDLQSNGLTLETDLGAAQHHVNGDGARLQQVFWNLLRNAIKFTPGGGRIRVSTSNIDKQMLRVEVADTGKGIPAETLPLLFKAFEQGGKQVTRQFGGLGLGLVICKSLVEMHGGGIRAESAGVDQGTRFIVELPVITQGAGVQPSGRSGPSTCGRCARVLVVEDHGLSAEVLTRLLQKAGHEVLLTDCLSGALDLAQTEPFDVLISDLGLPDGSGHDLLRQLRVLRPDVPAIAVSGYGTHEDIRRSKEAGFREHLTKPVEFDVLKAALERLITEAGLGDRR